MTAVEVVLADVDGAPPDRDRRRSDDQRRLVERRPDADFEGFEAPDAADLTVSMDDSRV